mmetsp:Transcript_15673/g.37346  ORF Transcript_15673/g.37346 Transcript_15673/m.37346 type:complete len:117 (+) Transcript_15673:60-410(+)
MRRPPRLMDAGCGVGGAMLWLERHEPSWRLEGYTLSTAQHEYIRTELAPSHRFTAHLRSYDEPASDSPYDAIYSIEALVHTPSRAPRSPRGQDTCNRTALSCSSMTISMRPRRSSI